MTETFTHAQQVGHIPMQDSAAPFRIRHAKADNWEAVLPTADLLPENLAPLADDYRAALDAWHEVRDLLTHQTQLLDSARDADAALIRERHHSGQGLGDLDSLTPSYDATVRQLAEAEATHVEKSKDVLTAAAVFMSAVDGSRAELIAGVDADLERLGELVAPYRRAVDLVGQHVGNAVALRKFYDEVDERSLPSFSGRPASALPALPRKVTGP